MIVRIIVLATKLTIVVEPVPAAVAEVEASLDPVPVDPVPVAEVEASVDPVLPVAEVVSVDPVAEVEASVDPVLVEPVLPVVVGSVVPVDPHLASKQSTF